MEFGNFANEEFVVFFSILLSVGIAIVVATILFAFTGIKDKKYEKAIKYESLTASICIIDVQKNKITSFNKSDLKHKITSDLMAFYDQFHPNDVDKVKNWIFAISVGRENVEQYLEADIMINNGRKPCFSLLKLLKFNRESGIIHIETQLLKYTTANNAPKVKFNKRHVPFGIVKRSQISQIINKNKSLRGYTFGIRFFYSKQKVLSNNKIEKRMLMTLKNEIYPFANNVKNPRQILDDGDNEIFLFDLKIVERKNAMQLANSIAHALRKEMEVDGFLGYISFTIGIVENGQYYQDFDTIMEFCKEACITGQTNEQEIVMHERNINALTSIAKLEEQINHIFQRDVLRYLFRPIINVKDGSIIGYFEYVKAYDSPFSTFNEMSKYAAKINKNVDLLATVCKHVIPKFVSETHGNGGNLFISISLLDIESVTDIIEQIPLSSSAKITLIVDEQEIKENATNISLICDSFKKITEKGYSLALLLKDKNLLLDSSVYSLFDYFVVGSAMIGEIRKNNRIRLSAYTLIESLLKYKKPIIASDLESWQSVELIIESGIQYISTDVVSPSNDMILPIVKKKLEKVMSMTEKYL